MEAYRLSFKHTHPTSTSIADQLTTNLSLTKDNPIPKPGREEVLIRLKAAALNYRDILVALNSPEYPGQHVEGLIPCADGAGIVEEVGTGVSEWKKGDEVLLCPQLSWISGPVTNFKFSVYGGSDVHGTLTQYLISPATYLLRRPRNLTLAEAASLPGAGGTAFQALFYTPPPSLPKVVEHGEAAYSAAGFDLTGKTVLTMGTGGVSILAVQLAKAAGAKVVATTSSKEKMEVLRKLGADVVISYKATPNWDEEVLKETGGQGVDLVLEVGGAGTLMRSLRATKTGGVVVLVGLLEKADTGALDGLVPAVLFGAKTIAGNLSASLEMDREMVEFVEKHDIHPVIGKQLAWENAKDAFLAMSAQGTVGKIVVDI